MKRKQNLVIVDNVYHSFILDRRMQNLTVKCPSSTSELLQCSIGTEITVSCREYTTTKKMYKEMKRCNEAQNGRRNCVCKLV